MPFVKQDLRMPLVRGDIKPKAVGDLCFLEYSQLMQAWRESPRWTTIHNQFKRMTGMNDDQAAAFLAFLEFYFNHGHPYEIEKKEENGDI